MSNDELKAALARVAAPLIEADGGELHILLGPGDAVRLHLGGRFSGCPGNALVVERVLRPLIEAVHPAAKLEVSSGALVPDGATRVSPEAQAAPKAG